MQKVGSLPSAAMDSITMATSSALYPVAVCSCIRASASRVAPSSGLQPDGRRCTCLFHVAYGWAAATSRATWVFSLNVPDARSTVTICPGPRRPLATTFAALVSTSPRTPTSEAT